MGMCDPKAIRNGKAWADVVNKTPLPPHPQTCTIAGKAVLENQRLAGLSHGQG
jgi:hypothetical protein